MITLQLQLSILVSIIILIWLIILFRVTTFYLMLYKQTMVMGATQILRIVRWCLKMESVLMGEKQKVICVGMVLILRVLSQLQQIIKLVYLGFLPMRRFCLYVLLGLVELGSRMLLMR
ncbi:hypothetical protein ES20_02765 [Rothia aeria]|nr:hypothetical protein ES20_02765 [Rothia aeria]KGJ33842.1 hypothetical protein ES18_07000 [Rothia aeria]